MSLVFKPRICVILVIVLELYSLDVVAQSKKAESQTIQVDGLARTYLLYSPENVHKQKMPLLIVLHGAGGTAERIEQLTGFDSLAQNQQFIVVYPQGIDKKWNDGRGRNDAIDDVKFIRELIHSVSGTYSVDNLKIYVAGISNGGFFTMRLACELSDLIAAVASVSATVEEKIDQNCQTAPPVSVMLFHGTKDPVVSIDGGKDERFPKSIILSHQETVSRWVHRDECYSMPEISSIPDSAHDGTFVTKTEYKGGKNNTVVISYIINMGGHTWPGAPENERSLSGGKTTHNLHATEVIWDFFKRHSK